MNVDDYMYTYLSIISKTAELYPTNDRNVVYQLSATDKKFYQIVQKVGEERMVYQLRQLFIELTKSGVISGVATKQEIIINSVTPLGYSILEQAKKPTFWKRIKKAAPKWAANSLTNFLIASLTK